MKIRLEWKYRTSKGTETLFRSDEMPAAKSVLIAEDVERTGRVKELLFIDVFDDSIWTMKEMKAYLKSLEKEPHDVAVFFDGGFEIESGRSGLGCVIYYQKNGKSYRLRQNAQVDQLVSNNEGNTPPFIYVSRNLKHWGSIICLCILRGIPKSPSKG